VALLHAKHHDALRRYVSRSLGPDRAAADDLVQDVFSRVLARGGALPPGDEGRPWLYRIATNLVIDHHRAAKRRRSRELDPEMADPSADPEAEFIREDMRSRIRDAVSRLPDEQREVFLLREYGDVPFKEIALRTGSPLGTVLARMHYAMTKVKKEVEAACAARGGKEAGEGT
jgi:RNA polymerase sigma-70 factor (ECF subfamily)